MPFAGFFLIFVKAIVVRGSDVPPIYLRFLKLEKNRISFFNTEDTENTEFLFRNLER